MAVHGKFLTCASCTDLSWVPSAHTHTHTHTHTHAHTHKNAHTRTSARAHTHTHTHRQRNTHALTIGGRSTKSLMSVSIYGKYWTIR